MYVYFFLFQKRNPNRPKTFHIKQVWRNSWDGRATNEQFAERTKRHAGFTDHRGSRPDSEAVHFHRLDTDRKIKKHLTTVSMSTQKFSRYLGLDVTVWNIFRMGIFKKINIFLIAFKYKQVYQIDLGTYSSGVWWTTETCTWYNLLSKIPTRRNVALWFYS